jgi:CheY-like chemotaxis protein
MPEMDGYSATKAIRTGKLSRPCPSPTSEPASILNYIQNSLAAEHLRDSGVKDWLGTVPIVAMTASAIKGDRQKCKDAGMDDYIAKPVRVDMLEKMLVKWCSAAVTQSRANPVVWDGLKALEYGPERPSIGSKSLRPSPGNTIQNNAIPVGGPGPGKKIGSIATALGETPAPAETPQGVRMVRQRGHLQEL